MAFNLINFKKGTLSALNALQTNNGIEEGTFYLTVDENVNTSRLFIGTAQNKALPVNHSIITVADTTALGSQTAYQDGDFAYVTTGNILAVRQGGQWRQINAISDSDRKFLSAVQYSISTVGGVATITWTGTRSDGVDVTDSITMQGSNGVTVSNTGKAITISGDPATLGSSAVASNATTVSLSSTGGTASGSVNITGGSNVTLSGAANNLTIAAKDTTNSALSVDAETTGFSVTVTDSDGNNVSDTINPQISVLTNEAGTTTSIVSFERTNEGGSIAALPVYSKAEIDRRLQALDGMTYKGTMSGSSIVNQTNGVHIGDTYKASTNFTLKAPNSSTNADVDVKIGDLIIVSGSPTNTETDGEVTGTIKYDVIPSGNDIIQTYSVTSDTNGIKIHDDISGSDIGGIKLSAGNQISLSESGTNNKTVTVVHGTVSTTSNNGTAQSQSNSGSLTIDAITGITTDNGHVTAITTTPFTVVDTNATLTSITNTVATTSNRSTVTTAGLLTHSNTDEDNVSDSFSIGSNNLTITSSGKAITANFVWGTFGEN